MTKPGSLAKVWRDSPHRRAQEMLYVSDTERIARLDARIEQLEARLAVIAAKLDSLREIDGSIGKASADIIEAVAKGEN